MKGIEQFDGSEASLLRYVGWLLDESSIDGTSIRNYLSAVTTTHTRIGNTISLTPVLQLSIAALRTVIRNASGSQILLHPTNAVFYHAPWPDLF